MIQELKKWIRKFEKGQISRRQLLAQVLVLGSAGAVASQEEPDSKPLFPANGLNHLALNVTNVARSKEWYQKHLGLKVLRDGSANCFLSSGDDFLALFRSEKPGLNHFCFTWPGKTRTEAVRRLKAARMQHRVEENRVYFDDPDGITVQVAEENDWDQW